jgi:hypothetical protein
MRYRFPRVKPAPWPCCSLCNWPLHRDRVTNAWNCWNCTRGEFLYGQRAVRPFTIDGQPVLPRASNGFATPRNRSSQHGMAGTARSERR